MVVVTDFIALNVEQWDMKLIIAKQHCSDLKWIKSRGERSRQKFYSNSTSGMCVASVTKEGDKEAGFGMETQELKSGKKIRELNGACMEAAIEDNLPVPSGKVGGRKVEV